MAFASNSISGHPARPAGLAHGAAPRTARSSRLAAVDLVGAPFEGGGEAAERGVEHAAHHHGERAAAEFVGEKELDIAGIIAGRNETPAIVHAAERAFEIFDQDAKLRAVERHPAGEGLANESIRYGHVGDDDFLALAVRTALAHDERFAQRH